MRTEEQDFSGLWIPLVTPFRAGDVDFAALKALVRRLAPTGIAGFVACGSTGEAASLDEAEQLQVLDAVLDAAGASPVVMGLSGYHLEQTVRWVQTLCERPIAGLLVPPPHYVRPSQNGLVAWFRAIADASAVPVIVYDIPYRTGAVLARDTLLSLARHPRIAAVKDCGGDAGKTLAVLAQGEMQVLAGEDLQMFATLAQGGAGAIAASAHVATDRFVAMVGLLRNGELAQAQALWRTLVPWVEAAFSEPNPALIKAALAQDGTMKADLRLPMTPASSQGLDRARRSLAAGV